MRKAKQPNESAEPQRFVFSHYVIHELTFILGVLATLVLPALVFVTLSPPVPFRLRVYYLLAGGLILLELIAVVFVRVVDLVGHKNRDVIHLKEQLTKIYLSALSKSALNPKLDH